MVFELVNVSKVIRKHYSSLREDSKTIWIIFLFFIIPLLVPTYLLIIEYRPLMEASVSALITAFSLFSGLLLSMVVFLFNIVVKAKDELDIANKKSKSRILVEHLYANTLYSILIAVFTLALLVFSSVVGIWNVSLAINLIFVQIKILDFVSALVYFVISHFLMILLMIIKRLFVLLTKQLEEALKSE